MSQEIIKTLKQNKLYEESPIDVDACNLVDKFFNTYTFNPTNKQKIPSDIIRDDKGRIILNSIPFIVSNKPANKNRDNKWVILNNGTKLLLKGARKEKYNVIELVLMYFLKQMNVNTANYDIAVLDDKEFLVSPSFLRNNEQIILPYSTTPKISDEYENAKKYKGEVQLLKTFFLDRIYGNIDRFPCNYGLITGGYNNKLEKGLRVCPLFDNAEECGIFIREDKYGYDFFPYVDKENDSSSNKVFNHLLGYEGVMHWIKAVSKRTSLHDAAEKLYKEKKIYVDNDVYEKMEKFFSDSQKIINEELKNKGKSLRISLT